MITSFSSAATEFSDSRIYAGFDFRFSLAAGNELGEKVGKHVFESILKEN
jgi:hypothetical protein